jgi:hypothetical protein
LKCEYHHTIGDGKNQYVDRIRAAIRVYADHCKAGKP